MNRLNREALKTILLILLIITSLTQVGILWSYQNHRFPISFLSGLFPGASSSYTDIGSIKGEFFTPYKVIASEGLDDPHWMIEKKDDTQKKLRNDLWNEAKLYLTDILNNNQVQRSPGTMPKEDWGSLVTKKAFIFEFKTSLNIDLVAWFLDAKGTSGISPPGVYKMIISPWDDELNYYSNTVYILANDKIYTYTVSTRTKKLDKDGYEEIFTKLGQDEKLRVYSVMKRLFPGDNVHFPIRDDILFVSPGSNKSGDFHSVSYTSPKSFDIKNFDSESNIGNIAAKILGSGKESYDPSRDIYDAVVFKTLNSVYRVYSDGLLEFKYIPDAQESNKGSMSSAFKNALEFISQRKQLNTGVEYYLSSIKEERDYYEFRFDYLIDEIPVFFNNYKSKGKEPKTLNSAVTIEANSNRVLDCWWVLKDFGFNTEKNKYNVSFADYLPEIFKGHNNSSSKNFSINDVDISYEIKSGADNKNVEPAWVITTNDDTFYTVPMRK